MSVLLTGLQADDGWGINPAAEIVNALHGEIIASHTVEGRLLPASFKQLPRILEAALAEVKPRLILGLGLWPGETAIRLERIAANWADFEIPDHEGNLTHHTALDVHGPTARWATLPVSTIVDDLLTQGIPARASMSAGTSLSNVILYTALGLCQARSPTPQCGFLHVPYLPQQVAEIFVALRAEAVLEAHQRADLASMSLWTMEEAVRIALATGLQGQP